MSNNNVGEYCSDIDIVECHTRGASHFVVMDDSTLFVDNTKYVDEHLVSLIRDWDNLVEAVADLANDMSFIRDVPAIARLREVYVAQGNQLEPSMQAYLTGGNKIQQKK